MRGGTVFNYHELKYEALTLYVNTNRDNILSILGFSVDRDNRVYAAMYREELQELGHETLDLRSFLEKRLCETAWAEVEAFCEQAPQEGQFNDAFWDSVPGKAGKEPEPDCSWNLRYNGILRYEVEVQKIRGGYQKDEFATYNFQKHRFQANEDPLYYAKVYFGDAHKFALAECWLEKGLMPPAYVEIAVINRFLLGKKTAKLLLKDGSELSCKSKYDSLKASEFLEFFKTEYTANRNLKTQDGNAAIDIRDIVGLRHGSRRHPINPDPLLFIPI